MILRNALSASPDGEIVLPCAQSDAEGNCQDGMITAERLEAMFGHYLDTSVPLDSETYEALLAASTDQWKRIWGQLRSDGVI